MTTITIPSKTLAKEKELVLIPRRVYEEFLRLRRITNKRMAEELDTDAAIKSYRKEKNQKKLRVIKSLANLD